MADWDQVEGDVKDKLGDATGDESLEREGEVQGAWGDTKDAAGDVKDRAEDVVDDIRDRD